MSGHTPWRILRERTEDERRARERNIGWTAHIDCAGDAAPIDSEEFDDQLGDLLEKLDRYGGCVGGSASHRRYGATFSVYTEDSSVTAVVDRAVAVFSRAAREAALPSWSIVRCEVLTFAEHDRELDD
jgi:hypothetical protein